MTKSKYTPIHRGHTQGSKSLGSGMVCGFQAILSLIHTHTHPSQNFKNTSFFKVSSKNLKKKFLKVDFGMCMGVYSSEAAWCAGFEAVDPCVYPCVYPCVWVCIARKRSLQIIKLHHAQQGIFEFDLL